MRMLIIGRGSVAKVLLASLSADHEVTVGLRDGSQDSLEVVVVRAKRLREQRPDRGRQFRTVASPTEASTRSWDLVVTTAPVVQGELEHVLRHSPTAVVSSVSQVPSELTALKNAAAGRPWALAVPQFLATKDNPVRWWAPGRAAFDLAGPGAPQLRSVLSGGAVRLRETDVATPLLLAATSMPFIAGFHVHRYDWTTVRRQVGEIASASDEARAAVAAEYGAPPPRPLRRAIAALALAALPHLTPLDLHAYVRSHFGGHLAQTHRMLEDWLALGGRHDLPVAALEALRDRFAGAELDA